MAQLLRKNSIRSTNGDTHKLLTSHVSLFTLSNNAAHLNEMSFGRHEGRSVAETKFRLQGVEECFEFAFLLNSRWFLTAAIVSEVFEFLLDYIKRIIR